MSCELKEMFERLAAARNHKGGAYALITSVPGEEDIKLTYKGQEAELMLGALKLVESLLEDADPRNQAALCDRLTEMVQENQAKRFQALDSQSPKICIANFEGSERTERAESGVTDERNADE